MAVSMKRTANSRDFEVPTPKKSKDDSAEELSNRLEVAAAIVRKLVANGPPARTTKLIDISEAPTVMTPAVRRKLTVQQRKRQPTRKLQQDNTNSRPNINGYSPIARAALRKSNYGFVAAQKDDGCFFNATNLISVQTRSPRCPQSIHQTTRPLPPHLEGFCGETLLLNDGEAPEEKMIAAQSVEAREVNEPASMEENDANLSSRLSDISSSSSGESSSSSGTDSSESSSDSDSSSIPESKDEERDTAEQKPVTNLTQAARDKLPGINNLLLSSSSTSDSSSSSSDETSSGSSSDTDSSESTSDSDSSSSSESEDEEEDTASQDPVSTPTNTSPSNSSKSKDKEVDTVTAQEPVAMPTPIARPKLPDINVSESSNLIAESKKNLGVHEVAVEPAEKSTVSLSYEECATNAPASQSCSISDSGTESPPLTTNEKVRIILRFTHHRDGRKPEWSVRDISNEVP